MSNSNVVLATALCMFWLSSPSVFASDEDLALLYGDEESVSIATGSNKPLRLAPSVASVITAKEIKMMGATDLDQVLETVPGLHVSRSFNRLNSIYSFRGIRTSYNPQVLFLVDGKRFEHSVTGARLSSYRLPVENIKQIEVVRGPGSAVYGADAFAGVINVITKTATGERGFNTGTRIGSFSSKDVWAQGGVKHGALNISYNLEWMKSNGDSSRIINADTQTILDLMYGTNASLASGPTGPNAMNTQYDIINTAIGLSQGRWKAGLRGWFLNDAGVGPGATNALDLKGYTNVNSMVFYADYHNDTAVQDWIFDLDYTYNYMDIYTQFMLFPPGAKLPIGADGNINFSGVGTTNILFPNGLMGNPGTLENQNMLDATAHYDGLEGHSFRFGSGFSYVEVDPNETKNFGPGVLLGTMTNVTGTPYIFMPRSKRKIWYISLQDEWQVASDWLLTAGLRYDNYSDFGDTFNPRLALVWSTNYNLTSKLLYGRAFRAPAFDETVFINNPSLLGNPKLKPEKIDTIELAFDYRPNLNSRLAVNFFYYKSEELIKLLLGNNATTSTFQNSSGQKGHGMELEYKWNPSEVLMVKANYALQRSTTSSGHAVPNAPGQQFYVAANWRFRDDWSVYTQANWVADRVRAVTDSRAAIDDYVKVDMVLRYMPRPNSWQLAAMIKNLANQDIREPSAYTTPNDYPMQGRSYIAEFRYYLN